MKPAPRNHIVTFRLTENEYKWLKNRCAENANSISEAARNAVLALPPAAAAAGPVEIKLDSFDAKLNEIIALLSTLKESTPAEENHPQTAGL
ncbi:MAG: hypothetical protein JOY95_00270 [Silvibacterium sp.]|nr:hypothetical protein [Silvibacterium sp.]